MALKCDFNADRAREELKAGAKEIKNKLITAWQYAGEQFLSEARNQPQDHALGFYLDQTGNLRNSIGYYIFDNGQLIHKAGGNTQGEQAVMSAIKGVGLEFVGLAGMNYASYVEAKGYNVISMQADACIINLRMYMDDIKNQRNGRF